MLLLFVWLCDEMKLYMTERRCGDAETNEFDWSNAESLGVRIVP